MKNLLLFLIAFVIPLHAEIYLRDNLKKAKKGDYIVTTQSKNYTLLHIYDKQDSSLSIEEITVPPVR